MKEKENELEIEVYACNGEVDDNGYTTYNKGMIYFYCGNYGSAIGGKSNLVARLITDSLSNKLKKNSGIASINFVFPNQKKSFSTYADGFFGRPNICTGAILVKPLHEIRRSVLSKEIKKIGKIEDKKGRTIELII